MIRYQFVRNTNVGEDGGDHDDRIFQLKGDETRCIPFDEFNNDYQDYLKWLAEGNTPEPSEDPIIYGPPEEEEKTP